MVIAETNRLILREFEAKDASVLLELNADSKVMLYTGDQPFSSKEDALDFIENYRSYADQGYGRWAVVEKETGDMVGWCGLKLNEENFVDLGYRFLRRHWGKGYATEAAKVCLAVGFVRFRVPEIIGRTAIENAASGRVLEKIGMDFWKHDSCKGIENSVYYRINERLHRMKNK